MPRSHTPEMEVEVRIRVDSPREFRQRIQRAAGVRTSRHAFTDVILQPSSGSSVPNVGTLRLRRYRRPPAGCALLLSVSTAYRAGRMTVQRSRLPGGKVRICEGSSSYCLQVAKALGFHPAFRVDHIRGERWMLPGGAEVVLERIRGSAGGRRVELGWWAEVAARGRSVRDALRRLRVALQRLGVDSLAGTVVSLPDAVASALRTKGVEEEGVELTGSNPSRRKGR